MKRFLAAESGLRSLLALVVALSFTAVFSMNYFHEGTAIGKYFSHQQELERVNEEKVIAYSDMVLYGDEKVEVSDEVLLGEQASAEDGYAVTERIQTWDKRTTLVAVIVAWLLVAPWCQRQKWLSLAYVLMAFYLVMMALFKGINGGARFSELAIPAQATRWMACVALAVWILMRSGSKEKRLESVTWLLVIAASLTFATHGYEAFMGHPAFRDLLYGAFESISVEISENSVFVLLKLIGIMDISLALIILFTRKKGVFLWMAIWGGLAALSRPIAFGDVGLEDALLRIANFGIPMLLFYLTDLMNDFKTTTVTTYDETTEKI